MQEICVKFLMPRIPPTLAAAGLALIALVSSVSAQETAAPEEEVFEYTVGEMNWLTGEGVEPGGFVIPSLYVNTTGGAFEPGARAEDFATSEHDPMNEWGVQAIHLHLEFEFSETLKGLVSGFGHQGPVHEWEAELEEARLLWRASDFLSISGGQFINRFGFQSDLHLHDWMFVNQNLANSRLLNEGELVSQGGQVLFHLPQSGLLSFGYGEVRTHAHGHGHGGPGHDHEEGEDGEDGHDDDDHDGAPHREHLELEGAGFQSGVFSADYRFRLPIDDSISGSVSLALGENGFGRDTTVLGTGFRKVWNGHDHGHGGPEFCAGAWMWQSEAMIREVEAVAEDGDEIDFDDYGYSNSLHYGLSDFATVSLRHDWVSPVEVAELADRHRISAAFTAYVDPSQRVRARIQYDHTQDPTLGAEHAAWFEIQIQWGGVGGSHAGHGH